jgi:hypothetical protein
MTSTLFQPGEHPDVTEISALSESLLPPQRQTDLRAHLADCELCAEVYASLEEVRDALGTLPGPIQMPEDVASRVDAALAAEALLEATTGEEGTGEDGTAKEQTEKEATAERGTSAASAATVSRETAPESAPVPVSLWRRKRSMILVAAASVAALTLGAVTFWTFLNAPSADEGSQTAQSAPDKRPSDTPQSATASTDAKAHTDPHDDADDPQVRERVQRLLSDQHTPAASPKDGPRSSTRPSASPSARAKESPSSGQNTLRDDALGTNQSLPSCIRDGINRTETPLAVDPDATFADRSGYLVVLPHRGGDRELVDAYLVDPSCVSGDPPGPGKVLYKRSYPRG